MTKDKWGASLSYDDDGAVRALEKAIEKTLAYRPDPLADVEALIAEHPTFAMAHALRAGLLAAACDRAFEPMLKAAVEGAEAVSGAANDRERLHVAAARAWLEGKFEKGATLYGRIAMEEPRDILAVQLAQVGDFYLGYSHMLRDRVARVLPQWNRGQPGYGYLQGMHAFGLEESGDYARAEEAGREAVALDPQDAWAAHAVAHVMEMQGRAGDGARWLTQTAAGWGDGLFSYHNWWHLALFRIDEGASDAALDLFDSRVSAGGFGQALELCDGSALLWRLAAVGVDVGDRWSAVADKWATRADDGWYAFNDLHAMMAFVSTGRAAEQKTLLAAAERAAAGGACTNAMMSREVGLPAMRGIQAFARGAYGEAIGCLLPVRGKANRFGGSHAQRDVFSWTLTEAAIRAGDRRLADALVAERLAAKPDSALNLGWARRAAQIGLRAAA